MSLFNAVWSSVFVQLSLVKCLCLVKFDQLSFVKFSLVKCLRSIKFGQVSMFNSVWSSVFVLLSSLNCLRSIQFGQVSSLNLVGRTRGAQRPLGPENLIETIDFTDQVLPPSLCTFVGRGQH